LRPGMYVVPAQFRTAMTFVNTGKSDQSLAAAFDQNALQRVVASNDAEVAFDGVPGRVFKAKVRIVAPAIAAGQLSTSATLIEPETRTTAGRALAVIDVTDDISDYQIPLGATAQVAIYRNTGIIFRYSAKSCCECEAGRIIYSSKDMAGVEEDRADIECPLWVKSRHRRASG
jgi:multidrug resistance efflux pump